MVAYSFKPVFVWKIEVGLGLRDGRPGTSDGYDIPAITPKRQTIRAVGKRRHARPGDVLQLYTGMRTRQCRLIGRARCVAVDHIQIAFRKARYGRRDWVKINRGRRGDGDVIDRTDLLNRFAEADGFHDWRELRAFWAKEHPHVRDFTGVRIRWEPL